MSPSYLSELPRDPHPLEIEDEQNPLEIDEDPPSINDLDEDPCDHNWELVDDSFSHELGAEVIRYYRCTKCEEEMSCSDHNNDNAEDRRDYEYDR